MIITIMTTSSFKFQSISFSVNFIKIVFPNNWYAKELFWENSEYSRENIGGAFLQTKSKALAAPKKKKKIEK